MSDYISKSAVIKAIDEQVKGWGKQGIVPSLFSAIAIVQNQPTISETEIIRKAFKRVLTRLKKRDLELHACKNDARRSGFYGLAGDFQNKEDAFAEAIEIVKEECEINE